MIAPEIARQRMQEADPVPAADDISDDLVAEVRAIIDAEIASGDQTSTVEPSVRIPRTWVRGSLAVAAAFAITIVLVGLVGLFRADETPVGEPATTAAPETTVVTTVPSTTAVPAESTVPTTVATTIPPKPASLEITWQRVPEQASLEDGWIAAAAEGESGYVAVGGTGTCSTMGDCGADAAVWVSADGITWERIESSVFSGHTTRQYDGYVVDGEQYINDVVWGPAGFVAVGNMQIVNPDRPVGWLERPGIWLSPDGRQWTLLPHDEHLFAGIEGLSRVVMFDSQLVAFGGSSAWLSDDGINWERVEIDVESAVADVTVWNDMLVAVGGTFDERPVVWTSIDGQSWTRVSDPEMAEATGNLRGVGGNADGLVAIGTSFPTSRVTTWRSEDGGDWSVAPDWLGDDQAWSDTSRTALSVERGTSGIDDDLILINGGYSATLWGTADGGQFWYPAGQFYGGELEVLASGAPAVFNTVNGALVAGDRLLAFGKVVAWSGTEQIGGLCYKDPGDGSVGSCRADAAIWVGTWDSP